jgi:hypothetical protein
MDTSFRHLGLMLLCEVCEGEVELPDDRGPGTGVCRQCGIAFIVDAPYAADGQSRSA